MVDRRGYAIELAVGRPVRGHGDIDVMVLRPDQLHVQQALRGWEWWAADPPGTLRPWRPHEQLPAGIHDVWCRPGPEQPWRVQVMIDESGNGDWISRRDPGIRRPIAGIGRTSSIGIPYLAPEIQLFYKASNPRPKDETDFTAILPMPAEAQRRWLSDALARTFGEHPWRDRHPPIRPALCPRARQDGHGPPAAGRCHAGDPSAPEDVVYGFGRIDSSGRGADRAVTACWAGARAAG